MAFVNEYIPDEEIITYNIPDFGEYEPLRYTIDKDRDAILFGYRGGTEDFQSLTKFVLMIKGEMYLFDLYKHVEENSLIWKIHSAPEISDNKEVVYEILRDAIKIYGFAGRGWKYGDVIADF